ncbi:MAG: EAL domain-containing protein, partial [Pseudomonadota bacterium]
LIVGDSSLLCAHQREAAKGLPPWIALASHLDEADQAMAAGATDFHLHPLDWKVVARRIHRLAQLRLHLESMERYRERLIALQRVAKVGEWTFDLARRTFQLSSQSRQLLGLGERADVAYSQADLLRRVHANDREQCARTLRAAAEQGSAQHCEFRALDGDLWLSFHAVPVRAGGVSVRLRGTLQDISAQRAQQSEIRRLAYYDDVTGLPNRRRFRERLGRALDRAATDQGELAVLFIDLDEFKRINDTLGHTFGDHLLKQVAERLSAVVRESDAISREGLELPSSELDEVARMGGDEFVVMLTGLADGQEAAGVASRIVNVLNRPIVIDGHDMRVTPSIGIALYPRDGKDAEALLRCADTAMYHAKARGRNRFEYFSTELGERALRRLTLEGRLRAALSTNQFSLVYQPKVALSSGRCVAVEAFLRWDQGEQRPIPPQEFLPVAESSGLIIEIGEWVVAEVLRQLDQWDSEGVAIPRVILNTSVTQLNRGKFCDVLAYVTEPKGRLQRLELDVTEHALMSMSDTVISELATLRERGLRIAVDDFGTGYSSLQNLRRLPLDALKIDKSFVDGLPHEAGDRAIVGAIISMGQQLGLEVVAEGVAHARQRAWLEEKGCDMAQGELIAPPTPAQALAALVAESTGHSRADAG